MLYYMPKNKAAIIKTTAYLVYFISSNIISIKKPDIKIIIAMKHKASPLLPSAKLDNVKSIRGTKLTIQPAVIKNKPISFIILLSPKV